MSVFHGLLQKGTSVPERSSVQFDDGRCRVWNDRRRVGSWGVEDVATERVGVSRFKMTIADLELFFTPDDPAGFSEEAGAVVDLRTKTGRFGLAQRLSEATGSTEWLRGQAQPASSGWSDQKFRSPNR